MAKVILRPDETLEQALLRFQKQCRKEGLRREIIRGMAYIKSSELRREAKRKGLWNDKAVGRMGD